MYTKSRNDKGISDSNIAFALSVKNIICDVERTTTKKLLTAAILYPLINIVGIAKPNIPTNVEGAIISAFGIFNIFKIGIIGIPMYLTIEV